MVLVLGVRKEKQIVAYNFMPFYYFCCEVLGGGVTAGKAMPVASACMSITISYGGTWWMPNLHGCESYVCPFNPQWCFSTMRNILTFQLSWNCSQFLANLDQTLWGWLSIVPWSVAKTSFFLHMWWCLQWYCSFHWSRWCTRVFHPQSASNSAQLTAIINVFWAQIWQIMSP